MPPTYAALGPEPLADIPAADFPLVVKPADGSSGRAVVLVPSPDLLDMVRSESAWQGMLIVQPYVPNSGVDLKVYSVGGEMYATVRASPLHPARPVRERRVKLPAEVARIATDVGSAFGLDLYGVDILLGPDGPVVVDVNDFPSFRQVPEATARVARAILELARDGGTAAPLPVLPATVPVLPVPNPGRSPASQPAQTPAQVAAPLPQQAPADAGDTR